MSPDLENALTAMTVSTFGLLVGLAGIGFVMTAVIRFLAGARGGLR